MISAFVHHTHNNSGKLVLQALVPFMELKNRAIFTQRSEEQENTEKAVEKSCEYYQRRMNPRRLKEIQQYIYQSVIEERRNDAVATLFPSSMILAINAEDDSLNIDKDTCSFELPDKVFVVDGQHRLMSMKVLYEYLGSDGLIKDDDTEYVHEYLKNYKFSCTILVNYDLWEQGQVFANVNFKQKPVNRSLYYEIYGSEYRENLQDWSRNNIYLAHNLVSFMNKHSKSPYKGHIRMLGTGKGYVSQAFFVEALMRHLRPNGLWWFDADSPDFDRSSYEYMAVELLTYYQVVRELFAEYWPKIDDEKGTLICKTTGTGAFVRLLADMREIEDPQMATALKNIALGEICKPYKEQVKKRLQPVVKIADKLFGKDSKYGGTGGRGLEAALYKEMREAIRIAKLIENNPIVKMTPAERLSAQETAQHASIYGKLYFSGIRNFEEMLDDYFTSNVIDDINSRANHYEYRGLSYLRLKSLTKNNDGFEVSGKCSVSTMSYLDSEEEVKFPMKTPCLFSLRLQKKDDNWEIIKNSVKVSAQAWVY